MQPLVDNRQRHLTLLVAGLEGAVGSTVAAAAAALQTSPATVAPFLTVTDRLPGVYTRQPIQVAGWETDPGGVAAAVARQKIVSAEAATPLRTLLDNIPVRPAPARGLSMAAAVDVIVADIVSFRQIDPLADPVLVNLLPACPSPESACADDLRALTEKTDPTRFPDAAYVLAALQAGVPVVNFTPNHVELPAVSAAFGDRRLPLCGRDGKTGQTFFKTVLASAFKRRCLQVEGWYSLNILGNADGYNLMDPQRAAGKLANKTGLLDEILGYAVAVNGSPAHKVHIDYYPPRGDAKEAWDVVDFAGVFGLPMSLRVNLQGRDSILAAPLVIDLACWAAALRAAGIGGPVPELAFYFKKAVGSNPPLTFEDQTAALDRLEQRVAKRLSVP